MFFRRRVHALMNSVKLTHSCCGLVHIGPYSTVPFKTCIEPLDRMCHHFISFSNHRPLRLRLSLISTIPTWKPAVLVLSMVRIITRSVRVTGARSATANRLTGQTWEVYPPKQCLHSCWASCHSCWAIRHSFWATRHSCLATPAFHCHFALMEY
jgi:hypothetical protein